MNLPHVDNLDFDLLLAAGVMLVLGFVLWLESVRWSRALVTLFMAGLGVYVGFLAPVLWHPDLARLTTIIIGIVVGAVLGAVGFRLIQALLAGCLLAALLGGTLAWHDGAFHLPAAPAHWRPTHAAASSKATGTAAAAHSGMRVPLHVAAPPAATRQAALKSRTGRGGSPSPSSPLYKRIKAAWKYVWRGLGRLSKTQQSEVLALAAGAMLAAILVGLIFPLATSLVVGAWLGPLLVLLSLALFARRFQPTLPTWSWRYLHPLWIYAGCGVLGMAVQYRHIRREINKGKAGKGGKKKTERDAGSGV